jgi:hypothetical protein
MIFILLEKSRALRTQINHINDPWRNESVVIVVKGCTLARAIRVEQCKFAQILRPGDMQRNSYNTARRKLY